MPPYKGISPIPQWSEKKLLKEGVAELPRFVQTPEIETFTLCFDSYRDDLSEIDALNQNCARHVIHDLRTIAKCYDYHGLTAHGIGCLPVQCIGAYKELFTKLASDINIKEHKVHSSSRIFYYLAQKKCFIVTIKNTHYETDKVR